MWARQERYSGVAVTVIWVDRRGRARDPGFAAGPGRVRPHPDDAGARAWRWRRRAGATPALLEQIESDPPRYLNSVYLRVMLAQNGSAILVAILAERTFGSLGVVTIASLGVHAAVLRLRRGDVQDVRRPAQRPRRAGAVALRVLPRTAVRLADPRPDRAGQRAASGQGPQGRAVRLRGGHPLDGGGRLARRARSTSARRS